jgi:hypothetical protein
LKMHSHSVKCPQNKPTRGIGHAHFACISGPLSLI